GRSVLIGPSSSRVGACRSASFRLSAPIRPTRRIVGGARSSAQGAGGKPPDPPGYPRPVTTRWAYLGPQGTFCEQAARIMVAQDTADGREPDVELRPATGVSDAIGAVRAGRAAGAAVALENSGEGG